jgi:uncharacterized protein (TIGR02186 family)
MTKFRQHLVLAFCLAMLLTPRATATDLVADLSNHLVSITTGFTGAKILLFGATEGEGDVVVVVRGPNKPAVVRRKGRVAGIWVNQAEMKFDDVPGYYAIAANRPLAEFVPDRVLSRQEIGVHQLKLTSREPTSGGEFEEFRQALIRSMQDIDLYGKEPARIVFLGNRLFRTDIQFPANAPVGAYTVAVYLVRDGDVVSAEITPLAISKVGFSAGVFEFARRHSLAYGVLAILIAAVAGWTASLVFRRG